MTLDYYRLQVRSGKVFLANISTGCSAGESPGNYNAAQQKTNRRERPDRCWPQRDAAKLSSHRERGWVLLVLVLPRQPWVLALSCSTGVTVTCTLARSQPRCSPGAALSRQRTLCQPSYRRSCQTASKLGVSQQAALPFPASKAGSETTSFTTPTACILSICCLISLLWPNTKMTHVVQKAVGCPLRLGVTPTLGRELVETSPPVSDLPMKDKEPIQTQQICHSTCRGQKPHPGRHRRRESRSPCEGTRRFLEGW